MKTLRLSIIAGIVIAVTVSFFVTNQWESNNFPPPKTFNNESNNTFPVKIDKLYVASFGNELKNATSIKVGNLYSATLEITRLKGNFDSDNDWYVLLIQVKNATGVSQATSWHEGQIPVGKSSSGGVYWRPDVSGNYSVEAFVWQSLEGTPLAQNRQINVQVLPAG